MILYAEGENVAGDNLAKNILEMLTEAYPGHPWAAYVRQGVLFIKYLDPNMKGNWGMAKKLGAVDFDANVLKRSIVMMAGEWLERCGMIRGLNRGDRITHIEGVPEKYQPLVRP